MRYTLTCYSNTGTLEYKARTDEIGNEFYPEIDNCSFVINKAIEVGK